MSADLNLTDKQQSEVKLILMEQFNKRKQIREEMKKEKNVIFGGRLAEYKYYDMHQIIGSALKKSKDSL